MSFSFHLLSPIRILTGLENDHTIHLVRGKPPGGAAATSSPSVPTTSSAAPPVNPPTTTPAPTTAPVPNPFGAFGAGGFGAPPAAGANPFGGFGGNPFGGGDMMGNMQRQMME